MGIEDPGVYAARREPRELGQLGGNGPEVGHRTVGRAPPAARTRFSALRSRCAFRRSVIRRRLNRRRDRRVGGLERVVCRACLIDQSYRRVVLASRARDEDERKTKRTRPCSGHWSPQVLGAPGVWGVPLMNAPVPSGQRELLGLRCPVQSCRSIKLP